MIGPAQSFTTTFPVTYATFIVAPQPLKGCGCQVTGPPHEIKILVTNSCLHSSSTGLLALLAFAFIILFALIVAAMGRGGLILAQRLQSLLDISAASPFAWRQRLCRCPDSVCDTLTVRRVVLPHAPDHSEFAAPQQVQREAARARRGGRLVVDPDAVSAVDCGTFLAALTERLLGRPASSHQQDFLFSISRNATGFDQDDAADTCFAHPSAAPG